MPGLSNFFYTIRKASRIMACKKEGRLDIKLIIQIQQYGKSILSDQATCFHTQLVVPYGETLHIVGK